MKNYLFGAVSVLSLVAAGAASANDHNDDGWYLRGNAGYGVHTDIDISGQIDSTQHGNGVQSEGNLASARHLAQSAKHRTQTQMR